MRKAQAPQLDAVERNKKGKVLIMSMPFPFTTGIICGNPANAETVVAASTIYSMPYHFTKPFSVTDSIRYGVVLAIQYFNWMNGISSYKKPNEIIEELENINDQNFKKCSYWISVDNEGLDLLEYYATINSESLNQKYYMGLQKYNLLVNSTPKPPDENFHSWIWKSTRIELREIDKQYRGRENFEKREEEYKKYFSKKKLIDIEKEYLNWLGEIYEAIMPWKKRTLKLMSDLS